MTMLLSETPWGRSKDPIAAREDSTGGLNSRGSLKAKGGSRSDPPVWTPRARAAPCGSDNPIWHERPPVAHGPRRRTEHYCEFLLEPGKGEALKVDLVRDVGPQYGEHIKVGNVIVDSIENIGANKLTAIMVYMSPIFSSAVISANRAPVILSMPSAPNLLPMKVAMCCIILSIIVMFVSPLFHPAGCSLSNSLSDLATVFNGLPDRLIAKSIIGVRSSAFGAG